MILLTGGTGLIGKEWLKCLQKEDPDADVIVLSRRPSADSHIWRGDIRQAKLGLTDDLYTTLSKSVTTIIHCAAEVKFNMTLSEARASNVEGTRNVLELARHAPRLEKFAHVSTVYIVGDREGEFEEAPIAPGQKFFSSYARTKYEAEQEVLAAMRELPAAIYRLSSVVGSTSGAVEQFNYFHQLVRMAAKSPLPLIPGDVAAPVDLIASDWAGQVLHELFKARFEPGAIYHICAGPSGAGRFGDLLDRTFALVNRKHPPRLTSYEECEKFYAHAETRFQQMWSFLRQYLPHGSLRQIFRNDRAGVAFAPEPGWFERVVASTLA